MYYSLDAGDGIESAAVLCAMTPYEIMGYKNRFCRLCRALNSLSEKQGRRVKAHYILGKSIAEIAEGVDIRNVRKSISKGIGAMQKYLKSFR